MSWQKQILLIAIGASLLGAIAQVLATGMLSAPGSAASEVFSRQAAQGMMQGTGQASSNEPVAHAALPNLPQRVSIAQSANRRENPTLAFSLLPVEGDSYAGIGGKRWLKGKTDDGSIIVLDDHSMWEIRTSDHYNSRFWGRLDNLVVLENGPPGRDYQYLLVGAGTRHKAAGKYLGRSNDFDLYLVNLEGASLVADDGQFLGKITNNSFDSDSITYEFGNYGNPFSSKSIFNQVGRYGSDVSLHSPFNSVASNPPRIYHRGGFVAYLTINSILTPRIDPRILIGWLKANE